MNKFFNLLIKTTPGIFPGVVFIKGKNFLFF